MPRLLVDESLVKYLAKEKAMFSRTDFVVIPCATKGQILIEHEKERADLILIDFDMPALDIEDFCADILNNEKLKHVVIVVVSDSEISNMDRCMICGVNAVISKPIDQAEFIETVTRMLKIKKRELIRVLMKMTVVGKGEDTFYATSHDISMTGISIETEKEMKKGDRLSFTFYLRTKRIDVNGEVARITDSGKGLKRYGIKFLTLDNEARSFIELFITMNETS